MFDRTFVQTSPQYPQNVSVHEHRQSTSEDARLLKALEDEALGRIDNYIIHTIDSIGVQFVTYEYYANGLEASKDYYMAFTINGRPYKVRTKILPEEITNGQTLINCFYEEFAKAIAGELIRHVPSVI